MSKTLKYVLIATAAGAVVYVAYKKLSPAPAAQDKPTTVGGAVGQIVDGVKDVIDGIKSAAPSKKEMGLAASPGDTLPDNSPYAPQRGYADVDALGEQTTSGYASLASGKMAPGGTPTRAARAVGGAFAGPYTFRGLVN
jgi:hypothetical protein